MWMYNLHCTNIRSVIIHCVSSLLVFITGKINPIIKNFPAKYFHIKWQYHNICFSLGHCICVTPSVLSWHWYACMFYLQITKKFRDEPLPHHGFLRSREFEMKGIAYCMHWMVLNLKCSIDIRNELLFHCLSISSSFAPKNFLTLS